MYIHIYSGRSSFEIRFYETEEGATRLVYAWSLKGELAGGGVGYIKRIRRYLRRLYVRLLAFAVFAYFCEGLVGCPTIRNLVRADK